MVILSMDIADLDTSAIVFFFCRGWDLRFSAGQTRLRFEIDRPMILLEDRIGTIRCEFHFFQPEKMSLPGPCLLRFLRIPERLWKL